MVGGGVFTRLVWEPEEPDLKVFGFPCPAWYRMVTL